MTVRLILGEDSFLAREGITRALESVEGIEIVAVCDDLDSLRAAVLESDVDVVLTDIRMPPTNTDEGIQLAGELRSTRPNVGVVVLSQHADPLYAIALFDEGSSRRAYLVKDRVTEPSELARVLREVADGGSAVDPTVVERLLDLQRRRGNRQLDLLTPRELEILGLIAEGRSNSAIAESLVITKRAVERHINAIFSKLDLGAPDDINRRVKAALLYLAGEVG